MAEKTADISHTLSVGMALLMDTVRYRLSLNHWSPSLCRPPGCLHSIYLLGTSPGSRGAPVTADYCPSQEPVDAADPCRL